MSAIRVPSMVYLDTSVIVATISSGDPFNIACTAYCTALAQSHSTIYFSQLLRLEFAQFIRKVATDSTYALPQHLFQQYQLKDYGTSMLVRQHWTTFLMYQFDSLLSTFFQVRVLPIQTRTLRHCINLMAFHSIESFDAAHVATALHARVYDLATTDAKFHKRVTSGLRMHLIH